MKKGEAIEEFGHVLPEVLKDYGDDEDVVRHEIWELYLDHLFQEKRISRKQRNDWTFPIKFRKEKTTQKNLDREQF